MRFNFSINFARNSCVSFLWCNSGVGTNDHSHNPRSSAHFVVCEIDIWWLEIDHRIKVTIICRDRVSSWNYFKRRVRLERARSTNIDICV